MAIDGRGDGEGAGGVGGFSNRGFAGIGERILPLSPGGGVGPGVGEEGSGEEKEANGKDLGEGVKQSFGQGNQ